MARKNDKEKIIPLPVDGATSYIYTKQARFPTGDPRNDMTDEEILAFAEKENNELDRMIKMVPPLPPNEVTKQEDEEQGEDFKVDLGKGVITQELGEGAIIEGGLAMHTATLKPYVMETPESIYTRLMTDQLVRNGIQCLRRQIDKDLTTLDQVSMGPITSITRRAILDHQDRLYEQVSALRKAVIPIGMDDVSVRYEDIPEWAEAYIRRYVKGSIGQLLKLVNEDDI